MQKKIQPSSVFIKKSYKVPKSYYLLWIVVHHALKYMKKVQCGISYLKLKINIFFNWEVPKSMQNI